MVKSTQLPIKGPHTAGIPVSNGDWPTFDTLRHEIDRIFKSFHRGFSPSDWACPSLARLDG